MVSKQLLTDIFFIWKFKHVMRYHLELWQLYKSCLYFLEKNDAQKWGGGGYAAVSLCKNIQSATLSTFNQMYYAACDSKLRNVVCRDPTLVSPVWNWSGAGIITILEHSFKRQPESVFKKSSHFARVPTSNPNLYAAHLQTTSYTFKVKREHIYPQIIPSHVENNNAYV